jgi:hypothetical protein
MANQTIQIHKICFQQTIFNEGMAEKSINYCDSIINIPNMKSMDSFIFYTTDKPDDMGLLFEYEFYNENYTTGMISPFTKTIYSAKGNEYYSHEFIPILLGSYKRKEGSNFSYISEECLVCFLGEYNTDNYRYKLYYLATDYLANKSTYTLSNLLYNTAAYDGYQTAYTTGIIFG